MTSGTPLPSLFVSHGSPMLSLEPQDRLHQRLLTLAGTLPARPTAIIVATAHWITARPMVGAAAAPETIHDFYGFPEPLYRLRYPAPGAPDLAARVAALTGAGIDADAGIDHGVWVPLRLAWPQADIPVVPLAVQPDLGPAHHVALGRALAPLRAEGVLIVGSGGAVHNLRAWRRGGAAEDWAMRFDAALTHAAETGDETALCALAATPDGRQSHPSDEHYLPLLVAFGAAGAGARGTTLLDGFVDGSLGVGCYAFSAAA